MKPVKIELRYILLILITSIITVADLFINTGRSANGDGLIHTIAPTLFANAISSGNFPVTWIDGFANYGYPLGSISQQLTTYLTSILIIISKNPILSFNICIFLGVLLSSIFFYYFLRIYFLPLYSFIGVLLFNFSPYRILNIYQRGALPELFSGVFFPLLLIAVYYTIQKRKIYGFFLFVVTISLLILTHPFMLVVSMFLLVPYILFLLYKRYKNLNELLKELFSYALVLMLGALLGIAITSYYSLPLLFEIKYFYYGSAVNHLTPGNFLDTENFFFYTYPYFTKLDIFGRGFFVNAGLIESLLILFSMFYFFFRFFRNKKLKKLSILDFAIFTGLIYIFMTLEWSNVIYSHVSFLSNIQFPWRMLSGFIFIPPIILAYFLSKLKSKLLLAIFVILICVPAFTQLYGKNYTKYEYNFYTFTEYNLNAVVMNTIWTGRSEDYPIKKQKWDIIEGKGRVLKSKINNTYRRYQVEAESRIRMVDYTFYFPGWKVYVDSKPVSIEFQNPNYRGAITYLVPQGNHIIEIKYSDTKIRLIGKVLSILSVIFLGIIFIMRKKIIKLSKFKFLT